jgi:hypothetical protein
MISSIVSVARGLAAGQSLVSMNDTENSVRAGRDALGTSLLQCGEIWIVLGVVEKLLKAMSKAPFAVSTRRICYLTPFVTTYLASKLKNRAARQILLKIEDNTGALCRLAAVVSSVAFIALGQTLYGYALLLMLVIGRLDQKGTLPEKTRQILHKYAEPFSLSLGLITATNLSDFFTSSFFLLSFITDYLPNKKPVENYSLPDEPKLLKLPAHNLLISRKAAVKINSRYLLERPTVPVPNIDMMILKTQFDQIVWDKGNCMALRQKLKNDKRFIADYFTVEGKTDQELINYASQALEELLTSIKNRHIANGEPSNYDRMEDYLKTIADILEKEKDPIIKTDALLRLAVEGGGYCGPGKYEAIEEIYFSLIGQKASLRTKVLLCLQDFRRGLYNTVFYEKVSDNPIFKIFDAFDLHFYNFEEKVFGKIFALHRGAVENDSQAFVDAFTRKVFLVIGSAPYRKAFKKGHTSSRITECVQRTFGTPRLPAEDFNAWLKGWIEREVTDETLRKEMLEAATLHEYDTVIIENRKPQPVIKPEYITAFLVDMGILELMSQPIPLNI